MTNYQNVKVLPAPAESLLAAQMIGGLTQKLMLRSGLFTPDTIILIVVQDFTAMFRFDKPVDHDVVAALPDALLLHVGRDLDPPRLIFVLHLDPPCLLTKEGTPDVTFIQRVVIQQLAHILLHVRGVPASGQVGVDEHQKFGPRFQAAEAELRQFLLQGAAT